MPLASVGFVLIKAVRIRLNHLAALQEYEPDLLGRHALDKHFSSCERTPQIRHDRLGIHRRVAGNGPKVFRRVAGHPANFVDNTLWREAQRFTRSEEHTSELQSLAYLVC